MAKIRPVKLIQAPGGFRCCPFQGVGSVFVDSLWMLCVWSLFCNNSVISDLSSSTITEEERDGRVTLIVF